MKIFGMILHGISSKNETMRTANHNNRQAGFTQHHFPLRTKKGSGPVSNRIKQGSPSTAFVRKSGAGFTLIELIIYIAIAVIVLRIVASVNGNLQNYSTRSRYYTAVQRDFMTVMGRLRQEIHAANDITTAQSVFSGNPGTLTLVMSDASVNPTVFTTQAQGTGLQLTVQQGMQPAYGLNGGDTTIDKIVFTNVSSPSQSTRIVQIGLTVRSANPNNLPQRDFTLSATTSIELMDTP